ncbi:MAG: sigma-54-dependent Fis family transcriptional regulator [Alcanivorax sp.]|jgi:two-component system, NtrC family, response regulator PilR|uniref:sigma-54-dependent transcriptional regulator n=1 Tax=unclassified Ketobacter TaxID=2639109 RepID=UPI000F27BCB2|nr:MULTISPECIES: sigma-54 dependent transcriptional regulator [unclassified Ketobacter]MCK5790368.1 sigma-54-dependent Fis family transcriptional regulator [Ketobacter sp.]RLT88198.1 MAG: sigma-54-dependent Fis family transcriptional regulator [Ketobacter sp. GenoA1]RLT94121.1 MAG: sigma-54-dependent Fis family transcriptional regulator [Ketobacter sp.]TNC89822.1 MAG: sigma-54-dependent Fis family transcriptional regulator [Alcanivorax sp.]
MSQYKALIVDDEPDIRELLDLTLSRMDIETFTAANLDSAHVSLEQEKFDLCITDMNLPDGNGIDLVKFIQANYPSLPVAVLTAYGSMETAITALKAGAFDFVSKPVDLQRLRDLVNAALKLKFEKQEPVTEQGDSPILGHSPLIKKLQVQIKKLARSQAPVYINGESGSGKELVAREIHRLGPRAEGPFIPVNCGAIPSELMESEFFGHRKGSFTGAFEDKTGLFQAAKGGTLFLDEVADLPMQMQVKLLRAIQEKAVRPVGSQKEVATDVRILSATHKDLTKLVDEGEFRQDLFYRINVIQVTVPPLRSRGEDIIFLSKYVLQSLAKDWDMELPKLSPKAEQALEEYQFPGNVRELENILERAVTLCDDEVITPEHLQLPTDGVPVSKPSAASNGEHAIPDFVEGDSLEEYLTDIEKQAILKALDDTRWNRTAAAKKLGMSFRSLRYRLKKLGLDSDD